MITKKHPGAATLHIHIAIYLKTVRRALFPDQILKY